MKQQAQIKTIFFDGGDVLVKKIVNIEKQISSYLGLDLNVYKKAEKDLIKSNKEIQKRWHDIKTLEKEIKYFRFYNEDLLKFLGLKMDPETIEYMTMCHVKRSHVPIAGTREVLDYLFKRYQLGIISNCLVSRKYFEIKDFDLEKYFESITLSREIDIDKPNSGIYLHALKQVGKKPEECAFIDNKIENLLVARELGFGKMVLFPKQDYDGKDIQSIQSIQELASIF